MVEGVRTNNGDSELVCSCATMSEHRTQTMWTCLWNRSFVVVASFWSPSSLCLFVLFLVDGGDALDVAVVGVQRFLRASMSRHFVVPCSRVILQFVSAEMDFKGLLSRFCFRKRRQGKFSRPTSKT